jgi:hypothetical protein
MQAGDDIALTGIFSRNHDAPFRTSRMRLHSRNHEKVTTATPASHTPNNTAGIRLGAGVTLAAAAADPGEADAMGVVEAGGVKGRLMPCTTETTSGGAIAEAGRQSSRVPTLTSSEKGTRNFTDAIIQSQYRTDALFFLNTSANSPATPAKSVDCHK